MSRIGKKPVEIPSGVKVSVTGNTVAVEGPKGKLKLEHRPEVTVKVDDGAKAVNVSIDEADMSNKQIRAHWGTTRSNINNMVEGVTKGYSKSMEIVGVGWGAALQGQTLKLTIGYANAILMPIPTGLSVAVEKQSVKIEGIDKQMVGQFAASMRAKRKPEPYNGKGIKYADEVIQKKQGKQFGS